MSAKPFTIAAHEYLTNVRRKEFIFITIGLPLLMLLLMGISALGTTAVLSSMGSLKHQAVGLLDRSGVLDVGPSEERDLRVSLVAYRSREQGLADVQSRRIKALVVVDANYLATGRVEVYRQAGGIFGSHDGVPVGAILERGLLAHAGTDRRIADRAVNPAGADGPAVYTWDSKTRQFSPRTEGDEAARFLVPYVFSILLITAIFISASYLLRGISDEKENRVIEVILSSVTAEELLAGKLIGLAGVGLTQVGIWMLMGALPAVLLFGRFIHLSAGTALGVVLYFGLGFGLYATLMAGLGALGTSYRETQQISGIVSIFAFFPFLLLTAIIEFPNGTVARVLSYFPFTAPTTMVLRLSSTDVPPIDVAASAVLIFIAIWLLHRVSARLFRLGLLIYGKRPTFRETVRWLRQS